MSMGIISTYRIIVAYHPVIRCGAAGSLYSLVAFPRALSSFRGVIQFLSDCSNECKNTVFCGHVYFLVAKHVGRLKIQYVIKLYKNLTRIYLTDSEYMLSASR